MIVLVALVLTAAPVPPDLFLQVVGKGSMVRISTRSGKTILGEVIDESNKRRRKE